MLRFSQTLKYFFNAWLSLATCPGECRMSPCGSPKVLRARPGSRVWHLWWVLGPRESHCSWPSLLLCGLGLTVHMKGAGHGWGLLIPFPTRSLAGLSLASGTGDPAGMSPSPHLPQQICSPQPCTCKWGGQAGLGSGLLGQAGRLGHILPVLRWVCPGPGPLGGGSAVCSGCYGH